MNSDSFNKNNEYTEQGGSPSFTPPPDKLSNAARAAMTLGTSVFMLICGLLNVMGLAFGDAAIFMGTSTLSLLVYIILGGMCALIALDCPVLAPIPPLVAFVGSFAIAAFANGGVSAILLCEALMSVFPALCGIIIAVSMKMGAKRTGAIVASAIGTGIFTAVIVILSVYLSGGAFDGAAVIAAVDEARESFIEAMKLQSKELSELYGYDFSGLDIEGTVNGVFNLIPALAALIFAVTAFFSQLSLLALCRICNLYHKLKKKDTEFEVSTVTAAVFAFSYIMSIFLSSSDSAALAVFDNLSMILQPALSVVGVISVLPKREGNVLKVGCFPLVAVFSLLMFAPSLAFILLAVMGTVSTFKTARKNAKSKGDQN